MTAISRKFTKTTANSRKFLHELELPPALRKPFCERDLHRRIRSCFLVPRGPQAGLDDYRQGIEIKTTCAQVRSLLRRPTLREKKVFLYTTF